MMHADVFPYITSLGLAFVLIGFVMLIWRESVTHHFSTIAFFCFVIGLALTAGSIYGEQNEPPNPVSVIQAEPNADASAALRKCLMASKDAYLAALKDAGISCKTDAKGWPNRDCVLKALGGDAIATQLYYADNYCYRSNLHK